MRARRATFTKKETTNGVVYLAVNKRAKALAKKKESTKGELKALGKKAHVDVYLWTTNKTTKAPVLRAIARV